jgi:hypothetical protein
VKQAICSVAPRFSSRRLLNQYLEEMYAPASAESAAVGEGKIGGYAG